MQAAFVWTAMELRFVHAMQDVAVDISLASCVKYPGDAAHVYRSQSVGKLPGFLVEQAVIELLVAGDHRRHPVALLYESAALLAHCFGDISLLSQINNGFCQFGRIGGWNQ